MKLFHSSYLKGFNKTGYMQNEHDQFLTIRFKIHEGMPLNAEESEAWQKWLTKTGMPEKVEMSPEKMEVVEFVLENQLTEAAFFASLRQQQQQQQQKAETTCLPAAAAAPAVSAPEPAPGKRLGKRFRQLAIAAIIAGIIVSMFLLRSGLNHETKQEAVINEINAQQSGNREGVLPDGTRYWVNAGSSLRFPAAFGNTREVELKGEAYFEVIPDPARPFIVSTKGQKTEVLGTEFNISAWEKARVIRTTVLGGAVKVITAGKEEKLGPGQQAVFKAGKLSVLSLAKPAEATAWKRDSFSFRQMYITEIAAELERNYGVEFIFSKGVNDDQYTLANFSRKESINKILSVIQSTNNIEFISERQELKKGDKIIIRNKQ